MPIYVYRCSACGDFEKRAGYEDSSITCECGAAATRRPFSGGGGTIVEGRVLISDPLYAQDKQFKDLRKSGWDGDRAISKMRKNIKTDPQGNKFLDRAGMMT